ncbi:hypothetical protein FQA39_LY09672 [Lamprigera yunnana]|nr:hypothetical protein FQA39_LY09672 [Lamprigera yunnana]
MACRQSKFNQGETIIKKDTNSQKKVHYLAKCPASDSKWIGPQSLHPEKSTAQTNFGNKTEQKKSETKNYKKREKEIPLFTLFPNLKEKLDLENTKSTTEVTKLLVGEKTQELLRKPKKITPRQEKSTNDDALKQKLRVIQHYPLESNDADDEATNGGGAIKRKHRKVLKKTNNYCENPNLESSTSDLVLHDRRKNYNKVKRHAKASNLKQRSSRENLADDEESTV